MLQSGYWWGVLFLFPSWCGPSVRFDWKWYTDVWIRRSLLKQNSLSIDSIVEAWLLQLVKVPLLIGFQCREEWSEVFLGTHNLCCSPCTPACSSKACPVKPRWLSLVMHLWVWQRWVFMPAWESISYRPLFEPIELNLWFPHKPMEGVCHCKAAIARSSAYKETLWKQPPWSWAVSLHDGIVTLKSKCFLMFPWDFARAQSKLY